MREPGHPSRRSHAAGSRTTTAHDAQRNAILGNIPDQAWLKDSDCRYIAVNEAYIEACGRREQDILGKLPSEVWPPELAARYLRTDRKVLASGRRERYEEQRADRQGRLRWYDTIKTPVRNADGAIIGTAGISRDISERKSAECELIESRARLRELSAHLQSVREAERTRISRELHDELGQNLTALRMGLDWAQRQLLPTQGRLAARLARLRALADSTVVSLQTIAQELRPVILDDLGLAAAAECLVESHVTHTGAVVDAAIEIDDHAYSRDVRTAIYRILQEALTNASRHACARRITVDLREAEGCVRLTVTDDGRGMARGAARGNPRSLGLLGMHERANMVGGTLAVDGGTGRGVGVTLRIPIDRATERGQDDDD